MEKVKDVCPEDCVYRGLVSTYGSREPCCLYALMTGMARGCSIADCDKYSPGEKTRPRLREDTVIYWEYETYERRRKDPDNPMGHEH